METIISEVYKYYPKNIQYGTAEYFDSAEYHNLMNRLEDSYDSKIGKLLKNIVLVSFPNTLVKSYFAPKFRCCEFNVLLDSIAPIPKNESKLLMKLGGARNDLHIYVSRLSNFYYYTFLNTSVKNNLMYYRYVNTHHLCYDTLRQFNQYMRACGFRRLYEKDIKTVVPDVETEFIGMGEANVFELLFSELHLYTPYNINHYEPILKW